MANAKLELRPLKDAEARRQAGSLVTSVIAASSPRWDSDGEIALGAYEGEVLLGASRAELVPDDADPRRVPGRRWHVLHLATEASLEDRGVGKQLLLWQRQQALDLGLQLMTWDQDPMDIASARFSVRTLGAVSRRLRAREPSPQLHLEVEWWIRTSRVRTWIDDTRERLELVDALEAGTPKLNLGVLRDDDMLWPSEYEAAPEGASVLVEIPAAFHDLDSRDASLAAAWRQQIERLLTQAFGRGYWLTDFLELRVERNPRAYYLLIDGERTLS